jgi:hypothetical protein
MGCHCLRNKDGVRFVFCLVRIIQRLEETILKAQKDISADVRHCSERGRKGRNGRGSHIEDRSKKATNNRSQTVLNNWRP